MKQQKDDELLDTDAMAKLLDVKPKTLENWRSNGRVNLPYIKIGDNVRYRRSTGEAFLEKNTRRSTRKS
jgi:predicted site-specific integrase-resolvase